MRRIQTADETDQATHLDARYCRTLHAHTTLHSRTRESRPRRVLCFRSSGNNIMQQALRCDPAKNVPSRATYSTYAHHALTSAGHRQRSSAEDTAGAAAVREAAEGGGLLRNLLMSSPCTTSTCALCEGCAKNAPASRHPDHSRNCTGGNYVCLGRRRRFDG